VRKTSRAVGAAGSLLLLATMVAPVLGASHREAPLISNDPAADHTDVFAWVDGNSPSKVNLAVNVSPMQDPAGGPNFWLFDPKVRYEIKIDNDRDARADITYRFVFKTIVRNQETFLYNTGRVTGPNDVDLNVRQTYTLTRIYENGRSRVLGTNLPVGPTNVGPRSNPSYAATGARATRSLDGGFRVFAGQRDDPFFVDLGSIFDLGGLRPFNPLHLIPLDAEPGVDDLQANNVLTIALQVPIRHLTKGGKIYAASNSRATVGIWAANYRRSTTVINSNGTNTTSGAWRQVSRMANPLINEVVIPRGDKDYWNRRAPHGDSIFEKYYLKPELAGLINYLYPPLMNNIDETGRGDLSLILLNGLPNLNSTGSVKADLLRLNTGIPACTADSAEDDEGSCRRLGAFYSDGGADLAAFPNGRRPSDDVTDIAIRAVAQGYGTALNGLYGVPNKSPNNQLGDGVGDNDRPFLGSFPYIALPNSGYRHDHHEPR